MTREEAEYLICTEQPPAFHVRTEDKSTDQEVYIYEALTTLGLVAFRIPTGMRDTTHLAVKERSKLLLKYLA